jgi:UDP-N-acetylmuramoylalanine--D-glutamate ligase
MRGAGVRLHDLRDRSVVVWGAGKEGLAAADAIAAIGPAELVVVVDDEPDPAGAASHPDLTRPAGLGDHVGFRAGPAARAALRAADVVVRSPGVAQTHPWLVELRAAGVTVTGGTALWLAEHAPRTLAVTGSKGKSTTSSLVSHLLTAAGRPNVLGGNIGVPLLSLPAAAQYVVELSSFQCADLADSPRVVGLTSLFPDHVDWHGGERAYYRDKLNVVRHGPDRVVVHRDETFLRATLRELGVDREVLDVGGPDSFHVAPGPDGAAWFHAGAAPLFGRAALPVVGRHNERNLCVALGVLAASGVDCVAARAALGEALPRFRPLPHRLTEIADPSGITFVDDSLATNPQAAIQAIDAYDDRVLTVILGGHDRGVDYAPLRDRLAARRTPATVIAIPECGPRIVAGLDTVPALAVLTADDLPEAVRLARRHTPAGGVVLLSPGAPSFGQFENYRHRAEVFTAAVAATRE